MSLGTNTSLCDWKPEIRNLVFGTTSNQLIYHGLDIYLRLMEIKKHKIWTEGLLGKWLPNLLRNRMAFYMFVSVILRKQFAGI
jgi:hypothetical protein